MSIRTILAILAALVCGGAVAIGVTRLMHSKSSANGGAPTEGVVVAVTDVPPGRLLGPKDVEIRQWPQGVLPQGAIATVEDAVERVTLMPLAAGELLLQSKVASKDAGRGITLRIPNGMRAFTIQTPRLTANVAGFILPGNRVDVLLNLPGGAEDGTGGGSTTTLLQAIEVLAVDQRLDVPADSKMDPRGMSSVTALVTPKQAALLDLGQNVGTLSLSLRNLQDLAEAKTEPAMMSEIRFLQEKPAPPVEAVVATPPATVTPDEEPQRLSFLTLRGNLRSHVLIAKR